MAVFGSPGEQDMLVDSFCGITGIPSDRARNYLEAHTWDLESALSTYYDDNPGGHSAQIISQRTPNKEAEPKAEGGYTNMKDMRIDQSKEMDKKKNEQFFAGGSDSSGQMIEGPPKPDVEEDIVSSTFKSAQEQGAESAEEYHRAAKKAEPAQFMGTGRRLGKSETEVSKEVQGAAPPPKPRIFHLRFYKDGFTVDDGELRKFDEPRSKQFMMAVSKGYIPDELVKEANGQEVHLEMEDNRDEVYTPSKPKLQPFGGSGQRLGSIAPVVQTTPAPVTEPVSTETSPLVVDPSLPVTTLQVRLADGTRLTQKFNHTHTIADLRLFISCKTAQTEKVFVIMTTFPNKELTDDSLTLSQANLLNAVVVQRFK
eukprot:TRINITY_DN18808_c0_g1_i1.p1 TRINITY_DN18808_c0_g1~~TRINITY_DN18808_c0_g1_i1.p1  ORF type:complete len:369 (-),score=104.66 TRINITY_DN18808_c0_g1_i1:915-2021(-)